MGEGSLRVYVKLFFEKLSFVFVATAAFLKFFEVESPATAFALLVQGDAQLLLPSSIFLIYHPQRVSAVLRNPP